MKNFENTRRRETNIAHAASLFVFQNYVSI